MCGIVGFVGQGNTKDILLAGLSRLEYRGYDSAGIALYSQPFTLDVYKRQEQGRVSSN